MLFKCHPLSQTMRIEGTKRTWNYYVKFSIIFLWFYTFSSSSKYFLFSLDVLCFLIHISVYVLMPRCYLSLQKIMLPPLAYKIMIALKQFHFFIYKICSFFKFIWHSKVRHKKTHHLVRVCGFYCECICVRAFPLLFFSDLKYNFLLLNFTYREHDIYKYYFLFMGNSTFPQSNCNNSQCSDNNHKRK